ncbi:hypothetical protein DFH07DRAFT_974365 [Mycena maculata]|uniref:Secreted protein n=1 Tax=Mycena maculata TaxID=230809 RepID=A0AAD7H8V3_9AGAR|nr:hypothetical protein DFH07DRAFT_974365 [Mycena maculata]
MPLVWAILFLLHSRTNVWHSPTRTSTSPRLYLSTVSAPAQPHTAPPTGQSTRCCVRRNRIPCTPVDTPTLILELRLGIGFPQGKGGGGSKEGEAER